AGVAEEDQVVVLEVVGRDLGILLDPDLAPEELPPGFGELVEPGIGPLLDLRAPRRPGPPDAEERAGEGVVDRALQVVDLDPPDVLLERPRLVIVKLLPDVPLALEVDVGQEALDRAFER